MDILEFFFKLSQSAIMDIFEENFENFQNIRKSAISIKLMEKFRHVKQSAIICILVEFFQTFLKCNNGHIEGEYTNFKKRALQSILGKIFKMSDRVQKIIRNRLQNFLDCISAIEPGLHGVPCLFISKNQQNKHV